MDDVEQIKINTDIYNTLKNIWSEMRKMNKEISSLREDVDKLIENNNGGKCYGRTA